MSPNKSQSRFGLTAVIAVSVMAAGCSTFARHAAPPPPPPTHHLITYQVIGSCPTAAIKFMDAQGHLHQEANVALPFVKSFDMHNGKQAYVAAMIHGGPTDAVYVGVNSDDHQLGACGASVSNQYQSMECQVENNPFLDESNSPSAPNSPQSSPETASQFCGQLMKYNGVLSAYADSSSPPIINVQFRPSISRGKGSMIARSINDDMMTEFMAPGRLQASKVSLLDGNGKPLCTIKHDSQGWVQIMTAVSK